MSPQEFWELTPTEVWWLIEARRPPKMYGSLTEHEVKEMYQEAFGNPEDQPYGPH